MGLSELTLSKVASDIGAAQVMQYRDPEVFIKFAGTEDPSTFDKIWDWAGDNKYMLGGLGLGALGGSALGGFGGLGLGLLGAAGGYLLNRAGSSDQNMGFMDRINVLTDGWQAKKNLGGMTQGAQAAIKGKYGGGADASLWTQAGKWADAPQVYRDVASNPDAMNNLNTVLGNENQGQRLGQLSAAHDVYNKWKGTDSAKHFNSYLNPSSDNFNSVYGQNVRTQLAERGIDYKSLGGLAGQSAEDLMANPKNVPMIQKYLNSPDDQKLLGNIMSTTTPGQLEDTLYTAGTGNAPTTINKAKTGISKWWEGVTAGFGAS